MNKSREGIKSGGWRHLYANLIRTPAHTDDILLSLSLFSEGLEAILALTFITSMRAHEKEPPNEKSKSFFTPLSLSLLFIDTKRIKQR
jgi:hypothetical protein